MGLFVFLDKPYPSQYVFALVLSLSRAYALCSESLFLQVITALRSVPSLRWGRRRCWCECWRWGCAPPMQSALQELLTTGVRVDNDSNCGVLCETHVRILILIPSESTACDLWLIYMNMVRPL